MMRISLGANGQCCQRSRAIIDCKYFSLWWQEFSSQLTNSQSIAFSNICDSHWRADVVVRKVWGDVLLDYVFGIPIPWEALSSLRHFCFGGECMISLINPSLKVWATQYR